MKHIDEKQLLLAVSDVGDDLLLRAEHSTVQKHRYGHWSVLAACFCLVAVLAVPNVMNLFRAGSSAPGENENSAPQFGESAGMDSQQEILEGIWGSAVITEVQVELTEENREDFAAAEKGECDADMQTDRAALLAERLRDAKVIAAAEDTRELKFTVTMEIMLDSGETFEALCDVENDVVKLEGYHFYCDDLSVLF